MGAKSTYAKKGYLRIVFFKMHAFSKKVQGTLLLPVFTNMGEKNFEAIKLKFILFSRIFTHCTALIFRG